MREAFFKKNFNKLLDTGKKHIDNIIFNPQLSPPRNL